MPGIYEIRKRYLMMQVFGGAVIGATLASALMCISNMANFQDAGGALMAASLFAIVTLIAIVVIGVYGKGVERANEFDKKMSSLLDIMNGMVMTKGALNRDGYITLREMAFQCASHASAHDMPRMAMWQQQYLLTTQRELAGLTAEQVRAAFEKLITIYTT